jgi:cytochrome c oxidase subunit 2
LPLTARSRSEWFKPLTREERLWVATAFVIAFIMGFTTVSWKFVDPRHQVPTETFEVDPDEWVRVAEEFAREYQGRVVPEGVEIPIAAVQFAWIPGEIRLKAGVEYRLVVSSGDVLHGFSLIGEDGTVYNIMVMPGMAYVAKIKFDKPGVYEIRCNEYCGVGHQFMVGKIVVVEG